MKKFAVVSFCFVSACGGDFNRKPSKVTVEKLGGAVELCPVGMTYHTAVSGISYCAAPVGSCDALCSAQPTMPCPAGNVGVICTVPLGANVPAQNGGGGGIYGANASVPASYTFLDTKDANLCLDAFIRNGTPVPDTAVARTINSYNTYNNGIALQDMGESSTQPIVNILTLDSKMSNVVFQLLNPNGYYCIIRNQAACSNVTIQRRCSSKVAQIEPMTTTVINNSVVKKHCFWWQWNCNADNVEGTTVSVNSRITETPCIP